MPPDSRQVDVQQERGERNPTPTRSATAQELATAAGAGDVKLTEPKLLPDEQELRRIIDLIQQTIVVLNPDGKAIYANRVALEYTGLSLDEVRAEGFMNLWGNRSIAREHSRCALYRTLIRQDCRL
jgi:PAS domain-containing protein